MYRIKFPSGEESTIESAEALTDAVRKGTVTSYCFIMHQRSGQWLPIVRHPHYHQALTARFAADGGAPADALPAILPDAIQAPVGSPAAERSTPAALDVPDLDDLLELTDPGAPAASAPAPTPPASAPSPAPAAAKPRGRSRDLEFLYVPESKAGGAPRPAPRTAGPPPRPVKPSEPPKAAAAAPIQAQVAPQPASPPRIDPPAPAPLPPAAAQPDRMAPTVLRQAAPAPEVVVAEASPEPRLPDPAPMVEAADETLEREAPRAVAVAPRPRTPVRRNEWAVDDVIDPVEAALEYDGPPPIELNPRRPGGPSSRFLFTGVALAVVLSGGLLAWSPWSGGPEPVAAAAESPAPAPQQTRPDAPAYVEDLPAEEDPAPVPDVFSVAPDAPVPARTSFGGTSAQTPGAVSELPAASPETLPGAPRTVRVAVPVVGEKGDRDSARLAELKKAIIR